MNERLIAITKPNENERCPNCGALVLVYYGLDIRFSPPRDRPRMYRAECSGDCLNPSYTSSMKERALEMWNANAIRERNRKYLYGSASNAGVNSERYELARSIIHKCHALKLPQTFLQRLGMMLQLVPLHGLTDDQAQAIVDRLNVGATLGWPTTVNELRLQARVTELEKAIQPFAELVETTSGRIPYERLSLADWHVLAKAAGVGNALGGDPQNPPDVPECCGGKPNCDVREYCAARGVASGTLTAAETQPSACPDSVNSDEGKIQ